MRSTAHTAARIVLVALIVAGSLDVALAQRPRLTDQVRQARSQPQSSRTSRVNVELLTGKDNVALRAQQWGRLFAKLGISARIRSARGDEQPEIRESTAGSVRRVTAIGRIHRTGDLIFPDRTFSFDESSKLTEWLGSLADYGAQGSPEGQSLWGLNEKQFAAAYEALSQPLEQAIHGAELKVALERFELDGDLPIRLSDEASAWLARNSSKLPKVRQELQSLSKGTALAILLNGYGLEFHPTRTRDAKVELAVVRADTTDDVWPIGWDLKHSRGRTAPSLYQMVPVEFDDVPLLDLLDVVSEQSKVPIRFDVYRIEQEEADLEGTRVTHPRKNVALAGVVLRAVAAANLRSLLRIDERGRPFLWVTTVEAAAGRR